MKKQINAFIIVFIVGFILVASGAVYTIDETQQIVVTQFGQLIGHPISKAGLYFKLPFIQTANYFEKRLLQWDGDANQIPTMEKRFIWVDTTARWKIVDALKFMQSVRTEQSAHSRLDDVIDASTRDIISSHVLVELIRNTNRLADDQKQQLDKGDDMDFGKTVLETIEFGREELSQKILKRAASAVSVYGIELVDVRIKRLNYVSEVQNKVYERMISERRRAAEQFRSEGQGKKAEIEGLIQRELKEIQSEAYRKSQEIKGKADAEAIKIYADAYNNDPEFYAFTMSLESYKKAINKETKLMLSTENEFYEQLEGIKSVE
ncbi:MAG: HflC protein [Omnitrophica WOR_2 bacterium GWF2_38_59]|nr:MAG: HflC protein [Omnitrophica WOR_2 bacterium GWF2_38_59]OGX49439.1 MAG: HflC protein [Omnitrophica WOR_2 bacterium RIFOXYA2_FULL_38_17]OGX54839.1 MAG: HflC protein [Omnitrophica WOR_2 bacterium RIFOXYA12_FULL_38_10]OGX55944.1 MAG: HflC protein [Omnitrophica WOR_2 bacterium RIFOXYB2_FULL_38_16]OGX57006.1 MAG: HflC protein [Omnitrophica WOR_2 bacterium RIFOXYC2_FULL_38_12]HBG62452.1 protease modulator HflC [Candidatus Omnitrophota bacterium]